MQPCNFVAPPSVRGSIFIFGREVLPFLSIQCSEVSVVSKTPCIIHVSDLWKIRNLLPGMCLLFPVHPEIC